MRNGNKFHEEVLFRGTGEMPLHFSLFYNSKQYVTVEGQVRVIGQWTYSYSSRIVNPAGVAVAGGTFELLREDGQSLYFVAPANPSNVPQNFTHLEAGEYGFFRSTGFNGSRYTGYEYERPDGMIETYGFSGELTEIRMRQGVRTILTTSTPATNVRRVDVRRSLGGEIAFEYVFSPTDVNCFWCPTKVIYTDGGVQREILIGKNPIGLVETVTHPADSTEDAPYSSTMVTTFVYEKTQSSFAGGCPADWECESALTGILDEEGRRWSTWDYKRQLDLFAGSLAYQHLGWAYKSYHGTGLLGPDSEKEDHVEFSQLETVLTGDDVSYDDKFVVTRNFGVRLVYDTDHAVGTEPVPPRIGRVVDIREHDAAAGDPTNIERVNTYYDYFPPTTPPSPSEGLINEVEVRTETTSSASRRKIEYQYWPDLNADGVPDRLLKKVTERSGPATGAPAVRVTDYEWNASLRLPSRTTVSKVVSGTPVPEFEVVNTYTGEGRLETVTVTDRTTHTDPYPTAGRVRTTNYAYTYYPATTLAPALTRVATMTVDGPRDAAGSEDDTVVQAYTEQGYLTSVTTPAGTTQWLDHDLRGQPRKRVDPDGTTTCFTYNSRGWLRTRTVETGPSTCSGAQWRYHYYRNGLTRKIVLPTSEELTFTYNNARKLTSVSNNFGESIEFSRVLEMNGVGRNGILRVDTTVKKQGATVASSSARYDSRGRLFEANGAHGQKTTYTYELADRLKTIVEHGHALYGNLTTTLTYDGLDRISSIAYPAASGSDTVGFEHNVRNQVTKVIDARSVSTDYIIDGFGETIRVASPDRGTVDYVYDKAGNLLVDSQDLGSGQITSRTRTYDFANRIKTESSSPSGGQHTWIYDEPDSAELENRMGRLSRIIDNSGQTQYGYDVFGRMNRATTTVNSSAGPQTFSLEYVHDPVGNLESVEYPSGRIVTYPRLSGRVTSTILSTAIPGESGGSVASLIEHFAFGAIDRFTYGNSLVLDRSRDASQRLSAYAISPNGLPGTAGEVLSRGYEYDPFNHVKKVTDGIASASTEEFSYDRRHRLDIAKGIFGDIDYDYDPSDNRIQRKRRSSTSSPWITEVHAPELTSNRLSSVSVTNPTLPATEPQSYVRSFEYDARGNVIEDARSPIQKLQYQFNDRNRMKSVLTKVVPEPGLGSLLISGSAWACWLHDIRRQRISGRARSLSRTTRAVATGLIVMGLFASSSRAQTCPPPSTPCAADQDCDLIPDAYELSTVDGNNQTLDLDLTCSADALLDFDGDGLSNLAEYQNANALFSFRDKLICGPDSAPTSECHPIIESFTLDKTSVLETGEVIVSWTTLHTVGAGRQLRVEPFGIIPSAEAALGNRTLTVSASTFFTMYASNENATRAEYREVEVFTESQTNTYNAANQRVRQVVGGTERLFVYGPDGQILAETTASGAPIVEYIYLEGEPLAQIHGSGSASKTYYVHNSHLGTPELLTDSNQAVVWAIETGPFGEQHSEGVFGSNVTQSTRFPGQIYDAGTQVSYNWHRYYDPSIGRYISADPIGQAGGVNVYSYAASNPASRIDPFGLSSEDVEKIKAWAEGYYFDRQASGQSMSFPAGHDSYSAKLRGAATNLCSVIPGSACDGCAAAANETREAFEEAKAGLGLDDDWQISHVDDADAYIPGVTPPIGNNEDPSSFNFNHSSNLLTSSNPSDPGVMVDGNRSQTTIRP